MSLTFDSATRSDCSFDERRDNITGQECYCREDLVEVESDENEEDLHFYSFNNSGNEFADEMKAKLQAAVDYVNELQSSYDELLDSFGQLEVSAKERIKMFEEKIINAMNYAKIRELEVRELWLLHNETSHVLRQEERTQNDQAEQLLLIEEELKEAKVTIEQLEKELKRDDQRRLNELDYEKSVLVDVLKLITGDKLVRLKVEAAERGPEGAWELRVVTEATTLRAKMEQKNQLLVSLQQETARLMKTHTRTLHEVEEKQRNIRDLEKSLEESHSVCEKLGRQITGSNALLDEAYDIHVVSKSKKGELQDQMFRLQLELNKSHHSIVGALSNAKMHHQQSLDISSETQELNETVKELQVKNHKLILEKKFDKQEIISLNNQIESLKIHLESLKGTNNNLQSMYDAACLENEQNKSEQDKGIEKNAALAQQLAECHRQLRHVKKHSSEMEAQYKKTFEKTQEELDILRKTGKTQQSSDRRATHKRLQILTEKVSLLNVQLSTTSEKLRETENHLASVEQEKRNLQQKLSALEEQYSVLIRSHSQQKLELTHYRSKFEYKHKQYF